MSKKKTTAKKNKKDLNKGKLAQDDKAKKVIGDVAEKGHEFIDKAEKEASDFSKKLAEKKEGLISDEDGHKSKSAIKFIIAGVLALLAILSFRKRRKK